MIVDAGSDSASSTTRVVRLFSTTTGQDRGESVSERDNTTCTDRPQLPVLVASCD